MRIPVILGTAREGRHSEKVARQLVLRVKYAGHDTELVDVRDFRLPATDDSGHTDQAKSWHAMVDSSDALLIVMPEYNHGYPGELKMALDLAYGAYSDKPVGICGVSMGRFGGARGVENLLPVLVALGLKPAQGSMLVSNVREAFDENGIPKDEQTFIAHADRLIAGLTGEKPDC